VPKQLRVIFLALFVAFGGIETFQGGIALAEETSTVVQEVADDRKLQIVVGISGLYLFRSNASVTGTDFGATISYIFHPRWSAGGGYHQGFNGFSFSTIYSAFELDGTFAITGTLAQQGRKVFLGDTQVLRERPQNRGGLRIMAIFSQYLFNGTASIYPYSGLGGSLFYDFTSNLPVGLRLGVRADITQNGAGSLNVIQGFVQCLFWL
jgi:hypothetical protein